MNIRAVYGTPCRSQYFCKRSNVSGTVGVRVRHVTTLRASETMFHPLTQFMTHRATLATVCLFFRYISTETFEVFNRKIVFHIIYHPLRQNNIAFKIPDLRVFSVYTNPCFSYLISEVSSRIKAFIVLIFEQVKQKINIYLKFHARLLGPLPCCTKQRNKFSVETSSIPACRAIQITLYTNAMYIIILDPSEIFNWQQLVTYPTDFLRNCIVSERVMSKFSADRTSTLCFIIHNHSSFFITSRGINIGYIKDQIEKPLAFFANQLRLSGRALVKQILLMLAHDKRHFHPTAHRKERKRIILNGIGTFVKMHGLWAKLNEWYGFSFFDPFVRLQCLVGICYTVYGLAYHLASKVRKCFSDRIISQMMQSHSIKAPVLLNKRNNVVATVRKGLCQVPEGLGLFCCVQ